MRKFVIGYYDYTTDKNDLHVVEASDKDAALLSLLRSKGWEGINLDEILSTMCDVSVTEPMAIEETSSQTNDNKYKQLCVLEGATLGEGGSSEFEEYIDSQLKVRVKFAEVVTTLPDQDQGGAPVPGTGGRTDLLFYIHEDDVGKFAVPRLLYGIRWWEDVLANNSEIYSSETKKKYKNTWLQRDTDGTYLLQV